MNFVQKIKMLIRNNMKKDNMKETERMSKILAKKQNNLRENWQQSQKMMMIELPI